MLPRLETGAVYGARCTGSFYIRFQEPVCTVVHAPFFGVYPMA